MIQRIRRAPKDNKGNPGTESAPIELTGFLVAPGTSATIDTIGRDGVTADLVIYTRDPDPDIDRTDLIVVDGTRYRIEGEIGRWKRGLSGRAGGTEIALVRGEG